MYFVITGDLFDETQTNNDSLHKTVSYDGSYWNDALSWLSSQEESIDSPVIKPAIISWRNQDFSQNSFGDHSLLYNDFLESITLISHFYTALSEQEAVSLFIIYLIEESITEESSLLSTLRSYIDENDANNLISWIKSPKNAPSYESFINAEDESNEAFIGHQWPKNAVYHDGVSLLTSQLDDYALTSLYCDFQELSDKSIRYFGVDGYDHELLNLMTCLADKSRCDLSDETKYYAENEFTQIIYVTQSGKELTYDDLSTQPDDQMTQDPISSTKTVYKDPFFNTMFYKTYIGIVQTDQSGQKSISKFQLPCQNMNHFYAQYIAPYPEFAYRQGLSAVVIAKYYEGALVNGTLSFLNETIDFEVTVQQNITHYGTEIPIDHDSNYSINGFYEVLVPAGEVILQVRRYQELGDNAFVITNVSFSEHGMYPAVSEEGATRSNSDFHRQINIEIPMANLEGYVYQISNESKIDSESFLNDPIVDATVKIYGVKSFDPEEGIPTNYDFNHIHELSTDETGYYQISSLLPGYYQLIVQTSNKIQIENTLISVNPGNNLYNVN